MRTASSIGGGLAGLLGLLLWCAPPAAAQPAGPDEAPHLQLFAAADRKMVALGASFVLRVEAYASPETEAAAGRLRRAFEAGGLVDVPEALSLVRSEDGLSEVRHLEDGTRVLVLSRAFILRTRHAGRTETPAFEMAYGGLPYRTEEQGLRVYQADPVFLEVSRAVVPVLAESEAPNGRLFLRNGTAFLVAGDALVTSYHVVMDARRVEVLLPGDRTVVATKAWAVDPVRDVAILYVDPRAMQRAGLEPLRLAATTDVGPPVEEPDEVVFTYGWPGGTQRSTAGYYYPNVILEPHERRWVSTNPVRPGDSGGPLLDRHGRVLGVVSAGTVLWNEADVLQEEVTIATDPRPALWQRRIAQRPRPLRAFFHDPDFRAEPHVQAMRLSALVATGRLRRADVEDLLASLDDAVGRATADAGLNFVRGSLYQLLGATVDAEAAFQAALDAYQGHFPASYMLGKLALEARAYEQAERLFRHTAQFPPYRHLVAYGLAKTHMGQLRYAEAEGYLNDVLRYDPGFAPAYFDLALCRLARGERTRAVQILVKLEGLSLPWASRLRQVLRYPVLEPPTLRPQPRASFSDALH